MSQRPGKRPESKDLVENGAGTGATESRKETEMDPDDKKRYAAMTLDEKLAAIDEEIRTIHHCFVSQGFTPLEIERSAKPFLRCVTKASRVKWGKRLIAFFLFIMFCRHIGGYQKTEQIALTIGRMLAVKIKPIWNWEYLYGEECLIKNPYYEVEYVDLEECVECEKLENLQRLSNVSQDDILGKYLERNIPIIVTDAQTNWKARELFTIQFLKELFVDDPTMKDYTGCIFQTSHQSLQGNNKLFLQKAAAGAVHNYFGHWENCFTPAAKRLREYYEKPYFLPPSTELIGPNWIMVSNSYQGRKYRPVDMDRGFLLYAQLKGESTVLVVPKYPCNETCVDVSETLKAGETLFMPGKIWYLDYLPSGEGETIALSAGGGF